MSQDYEGWGVTPKPVLIGLAIFVLSLLALVIGAGTYYNAHYAARTRPRLSRFAVPRLETIDTAPSDTREIAQPTPPAGVGRAMADTAAQGDALWNMP